MKLALGFNPVLSLQEASRIASSAEGLGFDSVWMHESLFQRDVVTYISAMAGATNKIRLGSGVINTFTRHPVTAATTFATLSELSGGRVNLGVGLGSFPTIPLIGHQIFPVEKTKPLRRLKEYIRVVRAVWDGGKVDFDGEFVHLRGIRFLPKPMHRIPIWIGGGVEKSFQRAIDKGDGFHVVGLKPPQVVPVVERLRRDRPDPSFTISARTGWDPQGMDPGLIREERDAFETAGIQHMIAAPWQKDLDQWLRSMDLLAELVGL